MADDFIGTQLAVIAVGLLPLNLWRSFRPVAKQPPGDQPDFRRGQG